MNNETTIELLQLIIEYNDKGNIISKNDIKIFLYKINKKYSYTEFTKYNQLCKYYSRVFKDFEQEFNIKVPKIIMEIYTDISLYKEFEERRKNERK